MKRKTSNKQLAQALYEVTDGVKGEKLHKAIAEFAALLVRARKISRADNIISEFEKYSKKQAGIIEIEIQSARKLDEKTLSGIKRVFGDNVEASESIDESLLGGVRVRTEDKILDGSLKTQLKNLRRDLV
ncbi:MAG: ATP synthase F1 subunit delta [Patescibacteria group bacterium]